MFGTYNDITFWNKVRVVVFKKTFIKLGTLPVRIGFDVVSKKEMLVNIALVPQGGGRLWAPR